MNNRQENRKKIQQNHKSTNRQTIKPKKKRSRSGNGTVKKILILLIALVLIAAVAYGVILLTTREPDCYEVSYGTVTMTSTSKAVLIKDETGYSYPEGVIILSRIPDGTHVNAGDEIALVRTADFENDWCEQLRIARRDTIDYMLKHVSQSDDVLFSALRLIDDEIETLSDEMLHVLSFEPEKYREYSKSIEELYESKETLLLAKIGVDSEINDYLRKEEALKNKINKTTQSIVALRSGIISYNTDGYANVYSIEKADEITEEILDSIINDTNKTDVKRARAAVDYTISDLSTCCFVLKGDTSSFRYLKKNDEVVINLNNGKDRYNSVISETEEILDGYLVKIKVSGDFDYLYRTRFADLSVDKSWSGIVLQKENLIKNKDELGVYVYEDGKQSFYPVTVLAENDTIIVVDTSAQGNKIKKGMLIVKRR